MPEHIVWGLQRLKQGLRSPQRGEFAELEYDLLDCLHRQRLHPRHDELEDELDALRQKCDALARSFTRTHSSLAELCIGQPTTRLRSGAVPLNTTRSALEPVGQETSLPEVRIDLLTYQVPISYCFQQNANAEEYPLVTLTIDTTRLQNTYTANIHVYLDPYGSSSPHYITLPAGQIQRKTFLPFISKEKMKQINDTCPATIRIDIHYVLPKNVVYQESRQVYLLSYNAALLWRYKWDRSLVSYTKYLAGWVTPRAPQIQKLLSDAVKYHPEKEFHGYNYPELNSREAKKREVRKIVHAIFEVLHQEVNIHYVTSSTFILSASEVCPQVTQWIRLPENILAAGGPANCIDASVLFASLLEHASLQPVLLLLPNHALVGWRVTKDDQKYEFLETTLIGKGDFDQAFQKGQEQYADACIKGFIGKPPSFLTEEYALLVDIEKCREQDIVSMG